MRRILTVATAVVVLILCACGGGSDSEASTTSASTTLPGTTTEPPATTSPRVNRFCIAAESLFTEVAELQIDDVETMRAGTDEALRLLEEMEANATARLERPILILKAATTRMKGDLDDAQDLGAANASRAALSTPAVADATESVTEFTERQCKD